MLPLPKNDFASPSKSYFTQSQVFFSYLLCMALSSKLLYQEPRKMNNDRHLTGLPSACAWHQCIMCKSSKSAPQAPSSLNVTISDLAIFNFLFTIRRGFWGVTYVADTCLLTIRPGGSHMTPPVFYWLDHITPHRWLPPSTLLWLSTRSLYVYFPIVLLRYISQACWVASSPRLDFFRCTTVLW